MDTYFAPPERTDKKDLASEIELISKNPVMTELLHSLGGLIAIVNEQRQIIAVNNSFLELLGIKDPSEALGLRPGEAVQCVHAYEEPAGCGTTKYCSTCGAAIAMVTSLAQDKPVERICALLAHREGTTVDVAFLVRSSRITIDGKIFLLVFMQDISAQQQRAVLERTFLHDMANMVSGVVGASELFTLRGGKGETKDLFALMRKSSLRLAQEIQMQKCLMLNERGAYHPVRVEVLPQHVSEELQAFFANHPAAKNKRLLFSIDGSARPVKTDFSLLQRVLCNMITNALEATDENGAVEVWLNESNAALSFSVWNAKAVREDVALRIFQRNFSTKAEAGRGVGTYAMKLFGEQYLGGKVNFTTSQKDGTVFTFTLPC